MSDKQAEEPQPLLPLEVAFLRGLQAREREIAREVLEPLRQDTALLKQLIEGRLGLNDGALGTTHRIDADSLCILMLHNSEGTD